MKPNLKRSIIGSVAILVLFFADVSFGRSFRVASGGFSPAHAPLWAAVDTGIFKKFGLDVEYLAITGGTPAVQALIAGELQVIFSTGALVVNANLQGADLKIIAGGINFFPSKLIGRSDIRAPGDLKDKSLGISRFGSASDYALRAALEKLGVNPKQVRMIQVGASMARLAALKGGSLHAALLNEPVATMATKSFGMNMLIDLADAGFPFPYNSFIVKKAYLEGHRGEVTNFMRGVVEGLHLLKRDRSLAAKLIQKYYRLDPQEANIAYDYYVVRHGEGILSLPDRKGLEFVISQIAQENPKAKGQTPESLGLLDTSILEEIKQSGFVEKVR
ncbi:MAG: ABC transporter substrate-binding protein [Deltaproteobacteria bacterium]|nr:ABC transporter substrate-binding protein [Deltaproteobacteria bacterium]